uniref:Protein Vpu n=1 Tax=Human immunodeficiency virus type 1 TaxID=11676 RepID=A0A140ED09_HV1|nr:vpu protein [Human immunodeficiency virus 1]
MKLIEKVDYKLTVGAFIVALILVIVVWTIVYIEYRKLLRQRRIDWLVQRIRERAEDSGNESEGDTAGIVNNGVDMGHLRLLDANDL